MFVKGNKLAKLARHSEGPTDLRYWLKRCFVDLKALTMAERADFALKAWTISVKMPTKATDRATRTDDAQRLIKALEGQSVSPAPVERKEGALPATTIDLNITPSV